MMARVLLNICWLLTIVLNVSSRILDKHVERLIPPTATPTTNPLQTSTRKIYRLIDYCGRKLRCEDCFGHGVDPIKDALCKYGCDRFITCPPPYKTTTELFTPGNITTTTIGPEHVEDEDEDPLELDEVSENPRLSEKSNPVTKSVSLTSTSTKTKKNKDDMNSDSWKRQQYDYKEVIRLLTSIENGHAVRVSLDDNYKTTFMVLIVSSSISLITLLLTLFVIFHRCIGKRTQVSPDCNV